MLRQVLVYHFQDLMLHVNFGKAMTDEELRLVVTRLWREELLKVQEVVCESRIYGKFTVHYLFNPANNLTILFQTNTNDLPDQVKKQLRKVQKEFESMFEAFLKEANQSLGIVGLDFDIFRPVLESVHKALKPKISIVGYSGVGKTTITQLIRHQEIPAQHIPTITGEVSTIQLGKLFYSLWDYAGQEQFAFIWPKFIDGSDTIFIVTDSTEENCQKSKSFIDMIKQYSPDSYVAVIANKQDLPGALDTAEIEKIMGIKTFAMIANDPEQRVKMINIIANVLEMEIEDSELLKPLMEKQQFAEKAEAALQAWDFETGIFYLEKMAAICIDLGNDREAKELMEKSDKFKKILTQSKEPAALKQIQQQEYDNQVVQLNTKFKDVLKKIKALQLEIVEGRTNISEFTAKFPLIMEVLDKISAFL